MQIFSLLYAKDYHSNVIREGRDVYIKIPAVNQIKKGCNISSATMILKYFGREITPEAMKKGKPRTISYKNTLFVNRQIMQKGFKIKKLPDDTFNVFSSSIKLAVDNGIPIWLTWYKLDDYEIENYIKFGTNRNKKLIKENFKNEEEEDRIVEFGHGFFQNDVTMHTATKYIYLLNIFENNEQATNKLIEYNKNIIEDKERAPLFWIALANVQWDYGRLLKNVKEKAIQCIESGDKIEKWKKELEKVKKKLNSKQPAKKKIEKIIKLKTPNWKKGDILLYQIRNKELKEHKWYNKYVLLQVIGMKKTEISYLLPDEFYDEEEIIVLYNWIGNHQIDLNKISELKTIFFKDEEKIYGRELKFFGLYHLSEEELKKVSIKVIKNDMNNLNTKELKLMYPFMYIYHLDDFEFAIIEALEREEKRGNLVKDL